MRNKSSLILQLYIFTHTSENNRNKGKETNNDHAHCNEAKLLHSKKSSPYCNINHAAIFQCTEKSVSIKRGHRHAKYISIFRMPIMVHSSRFGYWTRWSQTVVIHYYLFQPGKVGRFSLLDFHQK